MDVRYHALGVRSSCYGSWKERRHNQTGFQPCSCRQDKKAIAGRAREREIASRNALVIFCSRSGAGVGVGAGAGARESPSHSAVVLRTPPERERRERRTQAQGEILRKHLENGKMSKKPTQKEEEEEKKKKVERNGTHSEWERFLKRNCWSLLKSKQYETLLHLCLSLLHNEAGDIIPVGIVLKEVVKQADLHLVLSYFDAFPEHTSAKLHTILLRRSLKEGSFDSTQQIFSHCCALFAETGRKAVRPDAMFVSEFIHGCSVHGKIDEGYAAFEEFKHQEETEEENTTRGTSCSSKESTENTDKKKKEREGEGKGGGGGVNSLSLCNAVLALSSPNHSKCTEMFEQFVMSGFVPDVESLNIMMRSAILADEPQKCEDLYNYLRLLGMIPNMKTFSLLIESYGKQGKLVRAQSVVNQMQSLSLYPNEEVWHSLLKVVASKKDINFTQRIWIKILRNLSITNQKPSVHLFTTLMEGCMIPGEGHVVLDVMKQIEENGLDLNHTSYTLAIQGCRFLSSDGVLTQEELEKAWSYLVEMKSKNLKPDKQTYKTLISMTCAVHAVDDKKFKFLLKDMSQRYGPSVFNELSRELIRYHLSRGDLSVVWKMYEKCWYEWTEKRDGKLFNMILQAATSSSEFSRAFSVIKHMKSIGHTPADEQISRLESALVEHRMISNSNSNANAIDGRVTRLDDFDVTEDFQVERGETSEDEEALLSGVFRVNIHHGSVREIRFQVLSALNSLRHRKAKAKAQEKTTIRSLQMHLSSESMDIQIVRSLLENDLKLDVKVKTVKSGRQTILEVPV